MNLILVHSLVKNGYRKMFLIFTDAEIEDMQVQMNTEAGLDPDEGGVDVPQNTDGITRYPSMDGDSNTSR